jgi:MFS transporter, putative metabolite:H+ symporter
MASSSNYDDIDDLSFQLGTRIDSLRKIPLRTSVILAISLASFFAYYDFSNYAYISPVLKQTWNVQDSEIALGASLTVLGYVVGAFCITLYADLDGRKPALVLSVLILATGSILAASSQNMTQMMVYRLITGIGIGSEIAIAGTYIGEISPKSRRGRYTSLVVVLGWAGSTLSGPISFLLIREVDELAWMQGWRIILAIGVLPLLIALILRMNMPESPRWLLSKGRVKEANQLLITLGLDPIGNHEVANHLKDDNMPDFLDQHDQKSKKHDQNLGFKTSNRINTVFKKIIINKRIIFRRIPFLVAIWSLVLIPIYASLLLVVEYLNQGYDIFEAISVNMIASAGFVAGGICSLLVADKIERKYQIAFASVVMGAAFILRGIFIDHYDGLVISSFIAFGANAWLITSLIMYTGESFPTKIRSTCSGIVEGIGRLVATTEPLIFIMLEPFGYFNLMVGLSLFSFVAAIMVLAFGRNTLNLSLERLDI